MNIKKAFDKNECYFISDTHFGHANVINYCNRPFPDVETMDCELIRLWNSVVPAKGKVFIAGDMIHSGNIEYCRKILGELNGDKYLILGNHCYKNRFDRDVLKKLFIETVDTLSIKIKDEELTKILGIKVDEYVRFFISHYPHLFWERYTIHLHGHVHSGPYSNASEYVPFHPYRYDIGVDNNDYKPIPYDKLIEIILDRVKFNERIKEKIYVG